MSGTSAPKAINLGGTGDIDMDPDPTFQGLQQIYQAGSTFGMAWAGLLGAIEADEQLVQPGFDDLSVAFRAAYSAYEPVVKQLATRVMPDLHDAAMKGHTILSLYLELSHQIQPAYMRALE